MRATRLWLALSLTLLLLSRPAMKLVSAMEDDNDDGFQDFGEGEDGMDGEDEYGEGMDGGDEEQVLEGEEIPEGDDADVINLTNETLAARVASGEGFVLYFYAPWYSAFELPCKVL